MALPVGLDLLDPGGFAGGTENFPFLPALAGQAMVAMRTAQLCGASLFALVHGLNLDGDAIAAGFFGCVQRAVGSSQGGFQRFTRFAQGEADAEGDVQ